MMNSALHKRQSVPIQEDVFVYSIRWRSDIRIAPLGQALDVLTLGLAGTPANYQILYKVSWEYSAQG
jgi:hypothetical protein